MLTILIQCALSQHIHLFNNHNYLQPMTSFQRFQRNARSRISCDGKSSKRSGIIEQTDPTLKHYVTFSQEYVKFSYNPKNTYCRQSIVLTNNTKYKVYFKIRCNNPKNYVVNPYEEVVDSSQKIVLKFEFLPTSKDLKTYKKDKFEVIWGKLPSIPGSHTEFTQVKKLPVEIVQGNGSDQFLQSINNTAHFTQTSEVSGYPPSIERDMGNRQQNGKHETLLTKPIMIGVAAVSFLLGFLIG